MSDKIGIKLSVCYRHLKQMDACMKPKLIQKNVGGQNKSIHMTLLFLFGRNHMTDLLINSSKEKGDN
jgi:hypothetical protein